MHKSHKDKQLAKKAKSSRDSTPAKVEKSKPKPKKQPVVEEVIVKQEAEEQQQAKCEKNLSKASEIMLGSVMLAQCINCPPWPCQVKKKKSQSVYRVQFYGQKSYAYIERQFITEFSPQNLEPLVELKNAPLQMAIKLAIKANRMQKSKSHQEVQSEGQLESFVSSESQSPKFQSQIKNKSKKAKPSKSLFVEEFKDWIENDSTSVEKVKQKQLKKTKKDKTLTVQTEKISIQILPASASSYLKQPHPLTEPINFEKELQNLRNAQSQQESQKESHGEVDATNNPLLIYQNKFTLISIIEKFLESILDEVLDGKQSQLSKSNYFVLVQTLDLDVLTVTDLVYSNIIQKLVVILKASRLAINLEISRMSSTLQEGAGEIGLGHQSGDLLDYLVRKLKAFKKMIEDDGNFHLMRDGKIKVLQKIESYTAGEEADIWRKLV